MKKTNRLIGVVAIAMVLTIIFSGVALASAAQTSFSVVVNDGSARVETSFRSTTEGDVPPYDETRYDFNLYGIRAEQFRMVRFVNTDEGVDVENSVGYVPAVYGLQRIFIDEKVTTTRIAEGDNASICCDSSAETRVNAYALNYDSVSASNNNRVLFAANSAGVGTVNVMTTENKMIGNANGTWQNSISSDRMSVRNGAYNLNVEFMSEGCDYPALAQDRKEMLCPFNRP